jgi:hypothetical protein
MRIIAACLLALIATPVMAQQLKLQSLDKLAARASSKTEVNLDGAMLNFASGFLGDGDSEEATAKKVIAGLKGVYVRVYEFDTAGAFAASDVQPVRDQLRGWGQIVSVHDKNEDLDIWVHQEGSKTTGMVIISTEAKEITVVNLVGSIRPQDLTSLGGQFGIPKVGTKKKE